MFSLRHRLVHPIVQIHCWGGMGSQLHAWHLLELLKLRNPHRNFQLVFHTAGVTKRFPEINDFLTVNEIGKIDDFDAKNHHGKGLKSHNSCLAKFFKTWTKHFLSLVGIENNHESLKSLTRIYPWTRGIRGHYSRVPINDAALAQISSQIFSSKENDPEENSKKLVVHLRLGDLRDLADKSPTDQRSLRQVLSKLSESVEVDQTVVHSDSPEIVYSFLGSSSRVRLVIRDMTVTTFSALVEMVEAGYFVGTSSKLSLWASIFRLKLGKKNTFIPAHMSLALIDLLGEEAKGIHFYD